MQSTPPGQPSPFDDGEFYDILCQGLDYGIDFYVGLSPRQRGQSLTLPAGPAASGGVAGVTRRVGPKPLNGQVAPAKGSDGLVVIPTIQGLTAVTNNLSDPPFVSQPPTVPAAPTPVVATTANLPYSLEITPVSLPSLPSIQSPVHAEAGGLWLLFGGRTNGLHNFNSTGNFPPQFQNDDVYRDEPGDRPDVDRTVECALGVPASDAVSLSSSNQEFYQTGNQLYTVGGYSKNPITGRFQTYDSLTSINVSGLINAVVNGTRGAAFVRQIRDPRLQVTGGEMATMGGRTYLVVGQLFNGQYTFPPTATQVYSDEIRSFRIIDNPRQLTVVDFQAQRDPVRLPPPRLQPGADSSSRTESPAWPCTAGCSPSLERPF